MFAEVLVLLLFAPTAQAQSEPRSKCIELNTKCPGKGWVKSACDEKDPCGDGSKGLSTSDSDIGKTIGTAVGKVLACKMFGMGCPGSMEDSSARANYYGLTAEQRIKFLDAVELQEAESRKIEKNVSATLSGKGDGLKLRNTDEPTGGAKAPPVCGSSSLDVSKALQSFQRQAKLKAYTFIAKDMGTQVITKENLEGMKAQDYKEFHEKADKYFERLSDFNEELGKIEACLKLKGCDLIELNKKINNEIGEWLKTQLSQGLQNAIDRVKDAREFLGKFVSQIGLANEKAMNEVATCH